ncbi:MAG: NUDIX hydrolase [Candidatus Nanopelagicales bacterium]
MKSIQYAAVFVLRPAGSSHQLLMGRRSPENYMGGTWQLISGGIEPGETAWEAAIREVREEAGLEVAELYRLPMLAHFYRADVDAIAVAPFFAALVPADSQAVCNPEHSELAWVPIEDAPACLMWPDDRVALESVRTEILSTGPATDYLRVELSRRA